MKKKICELDERDEPIGIIISRGDRGEQLPVISAYVWGPAPKILAQAVSKVA